jgi:hypothetical protein
MFAHVAAAQQAAAAAAASSNPFNSGMQTTLTNQARQVDREPLNFTNSRLDGSDLRRRTAAPLRPACFVCEGLGTGLSSCEHQGYAVLDRSSIASVNIIRTFFIVIEHCNCWMKSCIRCRACCTRLVLYQITDHLLGLNVLISFCCGN